MRHRELHRTERIGWRRAAVLGANDGIVSTASLVVGVAAANSSRHEILLAGVAGVVAGALSMAAGEYVSVSSQADTERADLALERKELATQRPAEEKELSAIYVQRGLDPALARPLQAALASAATFSVGAALPILTVMLAPTARLVLVVSGGSLLCLAGMGALAARTGGASAWIGALRVAF